MVLESFLFQFHDKANEAHKNGADCFKAADYMGFITGYFEEGYYRVLSYTLDGQNHENMKDADGQPKTIVDTLRNKLKIEQPIKSRITQVLKKLDKLDKIPKIEGVINQFIAEVSSDFMALSKKSTDIYHTLKNMGTWEKF